MNAEPAGQNQLKMYHMANTKKIKHNDLLPYFIMDEKDLAKRKTYVRSCEKFFKQLKKKNVVPS